MNSIIKLLNDIPKDTSCLTTINFIDHTDNNIASYIVPQDICHNKLRLIMGITKSRYVEKRKRVYRLRNMFIEIDNKGNKKCFIKNNAYSKLKDKLLVSVDKIENIDYETIPKLDKYHSVIYQKIREIKYGNKNHIFINFIEERCCKGGCHDETINYFEINFINLDQETRDSVHDFISAIIS